MRKKRYPFKVMLHATIRNDDFERIVPYNITFMISEVCCKCSYFAAVEWYSVKGGFEGHAQLI